MGPKNGLCVLRPYRSSDQLAVVTIMDHAAMETVGDFFWAAVFSEVFPQLAFVAIAIGFVGLSLPVMFCASLVPLAVVVMYFVIWSAHKLKSSELQSDLFNIPDTYQADEDTGFWVAEVHDATVSSELSAHFNETNKVMYTFMTEEELDKRGDNLDDYRQHTVVACIAVTRSTNTFGRAWLRRFAVAPNYRRRGIATQLLQLTVSFCTKREYKGIELVTTYCHQKAREMYLKEGFEVTMNTRHMMNVSQALYMFTMNFPQCKQTPDDSTKEQQKQVLDETNAEQKKRKLVNDLSNTQYQDEEVKETTPPEYNKKDN